MDSDGVTVDLSEMSQVELSQDQLIASVGPGARWGQVYSKLRPHNVAVSGGRVASVGVGGLTLGGGKSFFAAQRGFACDNVRNFEVVLASGRTVQVNNATFPDLFQALKGGSNNFGIVTRLDLETFPLGDIWGGQFHYNASMLVAGIDALYDLGEDSGRHSNTSGEGQAIFAVTMYNKPRAGKTVDWVAFLSYTEPTPFPPVLHNLTRLATSNTARVSNLTDFGDELNKGTRNGQRYLFATATFRNDAAFMKELVHEALAIFGPLVDQGVAGLVPSTVLQPLTRAMLKTGCGQNALGLCPSDGNLVILDMTVAWTDAHDDEAVEAAARELVDWTTRQSRARGLAHDYVYLNYASRYQDPLKSYGQASHRQMTAVSSKYDPRGVFQRLVPGGFKL